MKIFLLRMELFVARWISIDSKIGGTVWHKYQVVERFLKASYDVSRMIDTNLGVHAQNSYNNFKTISNIDGMGHLSPLLGFFLNPLFQENEFVKDNLSRGEISSKAENFARKLIRQHQIRELGWSHPNEVLCIECTNSDGDYERIKSKRQIRFKTSRRQEMSF